MHAEKALDCLMWGIAVRRRRSKCPILCVIFAVVQVKIKRDLSPKTMKDSFHKVVRHISQSLLSSWINGLQILPLARDPWLLDSYINSSGHIRLGTIFMDLDALAGVVRNFSYVTKSA